MRPEEYRHDIEAAVAGPCVCGGRDNPDCERCVLVAVARAYLADHPTPGDPPPAPEPRAVSDEAVVKEPAAASVPEHPVFATLSRKFHHHKARVNAYLAECEAELAEAMAVEKQLVRAIKVADVDAGRADLRAAAEALERMLTDWPHPKKADAVAALARLRAGGAGPENGG